MKKVQNFLFSIWARLVSLGDKSAWIMLAVGGVAFAADPQMLGSLVSWMAFAFIAAAVTIFVSRMGFPSIKFHDLLPEVMKGNIAAAILMSAVIAYCAITFLAVVLWAK